MNVHIFDGKIRDFNVPKDKYSQDEKLKMFKELSEVLNTDGKKGLDLIINGHQRYDNTNDMFSDDILAEICNYIIKESYSKDEQKLKDIRSLIACIDEQLSDMFNTGTCAQGKTIRLFQIYSSIQQVQEERISSEKKE